MTFQEQTIGNARLILGDCRDVLPTLGKVDAVVTDPPYGINFDYLNYDDTAENLAELIACFVPWSLENANRLILTPGNTNIWRYPPADWYGCWTWDTTTAYGLWGWSKWQPILFYGKDPAKGFAKFNGVSRSDRIHFTGGSAKIDAGAGGIHNCPKPLKFMSRLLARCSFEDETILDPFMGSGTTGVAAVQMGRKFIGIEREERYFDIACKRIEDAQRQSDLFIGAAA